jgi:sarcinarray family protein
LKKYLYLIVLAFVFCLNQIALADPVDNDFGIVNAWYNGQEATVKNISLRVGEPAEITVLVYSKISGNVYVKLINPLVTIPYDVISGPTELDETIDNYDVKSGWSMNYTWIIKPNGEWTNGNAPINLFVEFSKSYDDDRHVKFTIANPIILDDQYSSSSSSHTTTDASSTNQSQSNSSPSFGIIAALLSVALVVMWKQRNI